jgi:hypothetical protein
MLEFLLSKLKNKDVQYIRGFKLSAISTFKTGGVAAVAIIPKDICEAVFVIKLFDLSGFKISQGLKRIFVCGCVLRGTSCEDARNHCKQ